MILLERFVECDCHLMCGFQSLLKIDRAIMVVSDKSLLFYFSLFIIILNNNIIANLL